MARLPSFLGAVATLSLAACGSAEPSALRPACEGMGAIQRVTFVHVNDLHADYTPVDGISPYSRIRGYFEEVAREQPHVLFTNGGDDHELGALAEVLSEGDSTAEMTAAMGFDVRVLGNHDFAWGLDQGLAFTHDEHADVLLGNTSYDGPSPELFGAVPFVVRDVGCVRVGLGGVVSMPWDERHEPVPDDYYPDLESDYDYASYARALVERYRDEVDVLVLLNHIGLARDERLIAEVPGIDVVLSAHSHTRMETPSVVGSTIIVQAGDHAERIARLDLDVDLSIFRVVSAEYRLDRVSDAPSDPQVQAAATRVMATYAPRALEPVGDVDAELDAPAIAALTAAAAVEVHRIDAALVEVRTVYRRWSPGALTQQDLLDTFAVERERPGTPGFSSFYRVAVSGDVLMQMRDALSPAQWGLALPPLVLPDHEYDLIVQKRAVFHPAEYLLPAIAFSSEPSFVGEVWETLDAYAAARSKRCLHLDVDTEIRNCRPE